MTYFSLGQQKVYLHTMYITFLCYFISFHESKLVIPVITYSLKKTSIAHWLISVTFELKCKFCGLLFDSQVTKWVKFCAYNKNIYTINIYGFLSSARSWYYLYFIASGASDTWNCFFTNTGPDLQTYLTGANLSGTFPSVRQCKSQKH